MDAIASEDVIFTKNKIMKETDALTRIVTRLGHPDEVELQRLIDAGVLHESATDIKGKSFLENDHLGVFDTTVLKERLLDTFWETVCERNDLEREETVKKAYGLLGDTMASVMESTNQDKSEFILYNSSSFLLNEGQASMATIAQAVMLEESEISKRVTTAFATAPEYSIERPHRLRASQLLTEALQSDQFPAWSTLVSNRQGQPIA